MASVSVSVCGCVYIYASTQGGQKRTSGSLEFQVAVSVWVLGTGLEAVLWKKTKLGSLSQETKTVRIAKMAGLHREGQLGMDMGLSAIRVTGRD